MFRALFQFPEFKQLALAASLAISPFVAHAADVLYTQPFAETSNGGYYASTLGGFMQYDSFTLASDSVVRSVTWDGVDLNELLGAVQINPASFTVGIYADDGAGSPGSVLSFSTIGNSAGATSVGSLLGLVLYQYTASLATPFQAVAGTKYWLGISDPTDNADWFWASGAGGDGTHVGVVFGAASVAEDDMSFTLQGMTAPVPEPSSAALLAIGGMGLLAFRSGRRQQR